MIVVTVLTVLLFSSGSLALIGLTAVIVRLGGTTVKFRSLPQRLGRTMGRDGSDRDGLGWWNALRKMLPKRSSALKSAPESQFRRAVQAVAVTLDPSTSEMDLERLFDILVNDPCSDENLPMNLVPLAELLAQVRSQVELAGQPPAAASSLRRRRHLQSGVWLGARIALAAAAVIIVGLYAAAKVGGVLPTRVQTAAFQVVNVPPVLETVAVRSGPGSSYPEIGKLNSRTAVSFVCFEQGTSVTGPYSTENIWDRLASGGYVPDAWIYTGTNSSVVPPCSTGRGRATGTVL